MYRYVGHTAWIWILMTKRRRATSDNDFILEKINEYSNIREEKNPLSQVRNNPSDPLLSICLST